MDRRAALRLLYVLNGRRSGPRTWQVGEYCITFESHIWIVSTPSTPDYDNELNYYAETFGEALLWIAERVRPA